MAKELKVGPLLGVESDTSYTICFLAKKTLKDIQVVCDGQTVEAVAVKGTTSGVFWRAVVDISKPISSRDVSYTIVADGDNCRDMFNRDKWSFHVPGENEDMRIAYASCNGFSSKPSGGSDDYVLWDKMESSHGSRPYSLLVMGGDQLYADSIWSSNDCKTVVEWSELGTRDRIAANASSRMRRELAKFYEGLYLTKWRKRSMSWMMACIPSVMMWDDHDIFDGWGSHPDELQNCDVYTAIYEAAAEHFELFQIRSNQNSTLFDSEAPHYSFGLEYRNHLFLGLDNRSGRTLTKVMSSENWSSVKRWLGEQSSDSAHSLFVMSAIPVVYRSFAGVEAAMGATPWQESLEDDVNDHWTAYRHEGERERLITILLNFKRDYIEAANIQIVILSGDVHVGSLGVIEDHRVPDKPQKIHQVVSSGIVHPTVGWFAWQGLKMMTGDSRTRLEHSEVYTENLRPLGGSKFIRSRNYANLQWGTDDQLWVEWVCPNGDEHVFPIAKT